MAMKMATEIKMCLGPNGFSDFLAGFKSLSLRHRNPVRKFFLTGFFFVFRHFLDKKVLVLSIHNEFSLTFSLIPLRRP